MCYYYDVTIDVTIEVTYIELAAIIEDLDLSSKRGRANCRLLKKYRFTTPSKLRVVIAGHYRYSYRDIFSGLFDSNPGEAPVKAGASKGNR